MSCFSIIAVGNSGVGKSFIENLIVGREVFEHKLRPASVTTTVEVEILRQNGSELFVYNIPGLIEAKEENLERNIEALEQAFVSSNREVGDI